jgi:chemotaxis protein MotB
MSESGGGHSSWIVTYSDMITLLMACFIMIITFASKEPEKYGKKKDSLIGGEGGNGVVGLANKADNSDSVVWRERPDVSRTGKGVSEMAPLYADPEMPSTTEILRALELPLVGKLKDSYTIRLPLAMLFQADGKLSSSATEILHSFGKHLRLLPYNLQIQVDDPKYLSQAMDIAQFLMLKESIHPSRLAVGAHPGSESWKGSVWLTCTPQL